MLTQPAGMSKVQCACHAGGTPAWGNATGTASPPLPAVNGTLTSKAPRNSPGKPHALHADIAFALMPLMLAQPSKDVHALVLLCAIIAMLSHCYEAHLLWGAHLARRVGCAGGVDCFSCYSIQC